MTRERFNEYVRQAGRRLYAFAYSMLKNQEEAEDAVQEVFIKMWNMGEKLERYKSVDALASTMIRNQCIDQLRKKKAIPVENDTVYAGILSETPHEMLEAAESDKIITGIIMSFADIYREIIELKDIQGMSYEEISEMTGQNINTLRVNLSRARSMLRVEYKKYFNEKRGIGQAPGKVL